MSTNSISLTVLGIGIAFLAPASASSFVYTSLTAWQASSPGNPVVLDFESTPIAYYASFASSPYSFTASTGGLYVLGNAAADTGSGNYLTTSGATGVTIALGSGVYGVAFNLGSNYGTPETATIIATDANGVNYTTSGFTTSGSAGPAAFWGLRNDVQLVNVRITFTGVIQPQLDNVRDSNIAPDSGPAVPEPASWILIASGGVGLFCRKQPTSRFSGSSTPGA
jgi:hypothetical protein